MIKLKPMLASTALIVVGCLQMVGDLTGSAVLRGLGAASHASPAPKVFTSQDGFETFASRFYLHWQDRAGDRHSLELTPEVYGALQGPYNRRNAYGAAISYGPVLAANEATRPMFESTSRYALCDAAPVLRELGVDPAEVAGAVRVQLAPLGTNSSERDWQLEFAIKCGAESVR